MSTGTIKRLVRDRGFGFIASDESSSELFFHSSAVESPTFDELSEGQTVEFETQPDPRDASRSRAVKVRTT
jgi:CspA family cold shock protein